jgi:hypothetical protein
MWKNFEVDKPKEDGFYLVFMSDHTELGHSQWIWIANWNMQVDEPEFQDIEGSDDIGKGAMVTHWMPMPPRPCDLGPKRECQLGVSYDGGSTWHKIDYADEIRGRKVNFPWQGNDGEY